MTQTSRNGLLITAVIVILILGIIGTAIYLRSNPKDNPGGFDPNELSTTTPGTTTPSTTTPATTKIKLYLVQDVSTRCDQTVAEDRTIPSTQAPATAAINLLLQEGNYPAGSKLNSLRIENGVAYADFNQATQSRGGSCAGAAAVAQVRDTLKQFSTVNSVVISIDGEDDPSLIFQP